MKVVPIRRILDMDILFFVSAGKFAVGTCCIKRCRAVLIVHGGVAVLIIDMSRLIVDNTCFVIAALRGKTVVENNLAVVGAVALRNAELVDSTVVICRNRAECTAGCCTVVLIACGMVGIGVGVNRTILRTCRRNTRP